MIVSLFRRHFDAWETEHTYTVYPIKYENGFVVLYIVVAILTILVNSNSVSPISFRVTLLAVEQSYESHSHRLWKIYVYLKDICEMLLQKTYIPFQKNMLMQNYICGQYMWRLFGKLYRRRHKRIKNRGLQETSIDILHWWLLQDTSAIIFLTCEHIEACQYGHNFADNILKWIYLG